MDAGGWLSGPVRVPFAAEPVEVLLEYGEKDDEPSKESLEGFQWIQENWATVLRMLQDQAYDFHVALCFRVAASRLTKRQIWDTERLIYLSVIFKVGLRSNDEV